MIEIPEAAALSVQLHKNLGGRKISTVVAAHSPHKFTWYYGNPDEYSRLLSGRCIEGAGYHGGFVELYTDHQTLLFNEGIRFRFSENHSDIPKKHQLLLTFNDGSFLSATTSMYGGVGCLVESGSMMEYYEAALKRPSPLTPEFDQAYFNSLAETSVRKGSSIKAFLATEQRIPGLGNGVLQDILFNAGFHPRQDVSVLSHEQLLHLHDRLVSTLLEMRDEGGRDTERDIHGVPGSYKTRMSRKTSGTPCPSCGKTIQKKQYMGGSVYFCNTCQPLQDRENRNNR